MTTRHLIYSSDRLLALNHGRAVLLFVQPVEQLSRIRTASVLSCYLAALPPEPHAAEPNPWALVLKTSDTRMLLIELRQEDPLGKTVVVCRERLFRLVHGTLQGCLKSWSIPVREGSRVGAWLDTLANSGATRYELTKSPSRAGAGARWWMECILSDTLKGFFTNHQKLQDLKIWLRLGWDQDGHPVDPGEMQTLQRGRWLEMA